MAISAKWQEFLLIFSVIFVKYNVLHILAEFENGQMSPRESAKNGRAGSHGLSYKIFFNSELLF